MHLLFKLRKSFRLTTTSGASFKITIIANINQKGIQLSDYIKNNVDIVPFNFHKNIITRLKYRRMLKKKGPGSQGLALGPGPGPSGVTCFLDT